jgi:tetratricopeptide (TPR) repeat protein
LEPLDAHSISELAAGRSVIKGYMLDFIAHFQHSAQVGLPVFSLRGGPGFVYAASFDHKGRGTLRFAAVDASKFAGQHSAVPSASDTLADLRNAAAPLTRDQAWEKCQSPDPDERLNGCSVVIAARGYGSSKRLADALDGRCWALNDKGEFDRALADCNAAIAANSAYSYAYNNRGTALLGSGNVDEAIDAFTKAIELNPRFIFSRLARGRAFVIAGNKDKAREDFQSALILDPTNQPAKDALTELDADQNSPSASSAQSPRLPEANDVSDPEEIR